MLIKLNRKKKKHQQTQEASKLAELYERFSPLIYDIAMQCSFDVAKSSQILEIVFFRLRNDLALNNTPKEIVDIIKLTVAVSKEEIRPHLLHAGFILRQFADLPMINEMLVNNMSLTSYCEYHMLSPTVATERLKKEFSLISGNISSGDEPMSA